MMRQPHRGPSCLFAGKMGCYLGSCVHILRIELPPCHTIMQIISGVENDVLAVWLWSEDGWAVMEPYQLYRACTQMHITLGRI